MLSRDLWYNDRMNFRNLISSFVIFSMLLLFPALSHAVTISEDRAVVSKTQTINDDVFISGGEVEILGTVHGDVYAVGGEVTIDGTVKGDVLAAGGEVTIKGVVENSVRAAGGQITISSAKIGRNISVAGGEIVVSEDTKVSGKSYIFKPEPRGASENNRESFAGSFSIWSFLAASIVGIALLRYLKPVVKRVIHEIRTQTNNSIFAGFVALFLIPFVLFAIMATLIGIPLALILGVLFAIELYLAKIVVAVAVGDYVNERFDLKSDRVYLNFVVGLLIIELAMLIPILNFFVGVGVLLLGLGAIVRVKRELLK